MPSPSDVILASLGLQARLGSEIAAAKGAKNQRELQALRDLGSSLSNVGQRIAKHKEEEEVASLETLFAAQIASGKADSFGEAAMRMELSSPAAQRARVQLVGQARQLTRQDTQDDRSSVLFGIQVDEAEHRAALRPGEVEAQGLGLQNTRETIEDRATARSLQTAREAREIESHQARMDAMATARRVSEIELARTEEGKAVLDHLVDVRSRVDRFLAGSERTSLEEFDQREKDGYWNRYFPPGDPIAQYAKTQYRKELQAAHIAEMEIKAAEARFKAEIVESQVAEVSGRHGGEAWAAGETAVMDTIRSVKFDDPSSYASAFDIAIARFRTDYLSKFPDDGISRSTLDQIGIQAIGARLEKGLLQSMTKRSQLTPQVMASLIARKEAWVNGRLEEANIGFSLDPNDPATKKLRAQLEAEYNLAMGTLAVGGDPAAMGLDETALGQLDLEGQDPHARNQILDDAMAEFMQRSKARNGGQ